MRTSFAYRNAVRAQFPDVSDDLRFPHYAALTILDESGSMSQKELSQRLRFDASDLVAIVDDLEKAGLVSRERDAHDRRRYQLRVSPAGVARMQERERHSQLMSDMFFAPLKPKERKQMIDMLARLDEFHLEHFDENVAALAEQLRELDQK